MAGRIIRCKWLSFAVVLLGSRHTDAVPVHGVQFAGNGGKVVGDAYFRIGLHADCECHQLVDSLIVTLTCMHHQVVEFAVVISGTLLSLVEGLLFVIRVIPSYTLESLGFRVIHSCHTCHMSDPFV